MPRNDDPSLMKFRVSGLPLGLDRNQVHQELEQLTGIKFADCFYIPTSKFDDAVDTIAYCKIKPEEEQMLWVLDRTTILGGQRECRLKWMDGPPSTGNQGGGGGGFKRPQNFDNHDDANKRSAVGGGGIPGPVGSRPAVCLCYATVDGTGRHIWAPLTDPVTFDDASISRVFGTSTINGGASTTVNQYSVTSSSQASGGFTPRGGARGGGGGFNRGSTWTPRGGGGVGRGGLSGNGGGGASNGGGGGWDDAPANATTAANGDAKPSGGDDGWGGDSGSAATPAKAAEPTKKEEPVADEW